MTFSDALAILRYLAYFATNVACTSNWIFDPADILVSGPPNVYQNFSANLLGDVTQNSGETPITIANQGSSEISSNGTPTVEGGNAIHSNHLDKSIQQHNKAIIELPDTTIVPESTICVPIMVTTDSVIAIAQFVIEYDSTVLRLDSVKIGEYAHDFNLLTNTSLPFAPSCSNGKNVLVQIYSSQPSMGFSGEHSVVAKLYFYSIGAITNYSPLLIDGDPSRTFLTTVNLSDIRGADILIIDGKLILAVEMRPLNMVPKEFQLHQNYPNPFNPATTIRYALPKTSNISLKIFNLAGQEVISLVDETQPAGEYEAQWNAGSMANGVYVCRMQAGEFVETRKLLLIK